jgi:hypothetical protein
MSTFLSGRGRKGQKEGSWVFQEKIGSCNLMIPEQINFGVSRVSRVSTFSFWRGSAGGEEPRARYIGYSLSHPAGEEP